jgi:hypothetical protein
LAEEVENRNRDKIRHQFKPIEKERINKNTTNGGAAMTNRRLNL